ncbi:hypothetical protein Acr_23g0020680 [Actinidia rufa]|uniref:Uncharacterized protein n=1 Tax=Actinidia rufa TaxID=165716 RepID=A0A7J0GSD7_9ERIC|nr:hypothetical protein Acr_23g0020680 [Actinidia rufa]
MFSSREFDYVFRYLEAEQIGAIVREQEKQTAWKKAQLQSIREFEENKRQRNLQVEKMKSEMLNLQIQLHGNSATTVGDISPSSEGLTRRGSTSLYLNRDAGNQLHETPNTVKTASPSAVDSVKHSAESPRCEITELEEDAIDCAVVNLETENKAKSQAKENPLISAVQLLDTIEHSSGEDGLHNEEETRDTRHASLDRSSSLQSDKSRTMSDSASPQIGRIFHHIWSQMRSNNDVSSITAKDGEWISSTEYDICKSRVLFEKESLSSFSWSERAWKLLQPITNVVKMIARSFSIYWKSLTQGAESPPYFVQLSLDVHLWPEDGIQPERIESGINEVLRTVHDERCKDKDPNICHSASRVHVQSIERSTENSNVAVAVFEVVYASPLVECTPVEWYKSLTPAADVANEILHAQRAGVIEEVRFPYPILSVIGGGKEKSICLPIYLGQI